MRKTCILFFLTVIRLDFVLANKSQGRLQRRLEEDANEDAHEGENDAGDADAEQNDENNEERNDVDEGEQDAGYNYGGDDDGNYDSQYYGQYGESFDLSILGLDSSSIASYHLNYGRCERIEGDFDEDSQSYGAEQFMSFGLVCNDDSEMEEEQCSSEITHVIRMDDYFKSTDICVENHCNECLNACNEDEQYCNTKCMKQCQKYYDLAGNRGYFGCSRFEDDNGETYYYGPRCYNSGKVGMGFFVDQYCEIPAQNIWMSLDAMIPTFDIFHFVHNTCNDCSTSGICDEIFDSAYHCENGAMLANGNAMLAYGNDDICSSEFTSASFISRGGGYFTREKIIQLSVILGSVLAAVLVTCFCCASYTYYIRHAGCEDRSILSGKYGGGSTITSYTSWNNDRWR